MTKSKHQEQNPREFYKYLPNDENAQLKSYTWGLITVFGSTYLYEDIFNDEICKIILQISITDEHLQSISNPN